MYAAYIFCGLILIAYIGTRYLFKKKKVVSPLIYPFTSGLIYIFLGLGLGEGGLGILNLRIMGSLFPLVSFGLGWAGFLFGFQLELRYIRKFSQNFWFLSFLQSLLVFCTVSGFLILLLKAVYPTQRPFLLLGMAFSFGLLSTIISPSLIHAISPQIPQKNHHYYLARFLGSVNGFWGIMGLGILVSFWHFPFMDSRIVFTGGKIFVISVVLSMGFGYVFHLLTAKRTSEQDLLVYLLGLVFFISGAAFYFNLSPLFTGMVLGISYSNLTKIHEKLYPLLLATEKPLYIVFLILIGALWHPDFDWRIGLVAGSLIVLRILIVLLPLPLLGKMLHFHFTLKRKLGFCFLSSGSIGIAYAVSIKLAFPIPLTDVFLSIALFTIILSELVSPWIAKKSLLMLGEEE